ncbi:hypothetical protein A3709_20370 [Halioglobus sp. HI00S01]|nr:hypothetical protein A3709_20370 [Halioglobus sp. HI00S01]
MREGDRFVTVSGRITGPFPKNYKSAARGLRALNRWLKTEAIVEAKHTNSDYHATMWGALDENNWSPADGDGVNLYLFGDPDGFIANRKVVMRDGQWELAINDTEGEAHA